MYSHPLTSAAGLATRRLILLSAVGLVVVACASNEGASDAATDDVNHASTPRATGPAVDSTQLEPGSTQPAHDETITSTVPPALDHAMVQSSPIAEVLRYEPSAQGHAEFVASTQREKERLIGECMREHGFEYEPFILQANIWSPLGDHAVDLPPDEYKARYGYGMATGLEAHLTSRANSSEPPPDPPNPNLDYYESLSEPARQEYDKAIGGEDGDGGCAGEAERQGDRAAILLEAFGNELNSLFQQVEADPRVIDADDRWRQCMADAGYDFEHEGDAIHYVLEKLTPVNSAIVGEDVIPGGVLMTGDAELTPELRDKIRAVVEEELVVARTDLECDKSAEKSLTRRVVRIELEEEFVKANRQTLDELFPPSDP